MMKALREAVARSDFEHVSYARVDFAKKTFVSFGSEVYFDLASLTKPLTLSSVYHHSSNLFSEEMLLLLNHRAGLPSWGLLSRRTWREYLLQFPPVESSERYSDYSALRLMLELEKVSGKKLQRLCDFFWDKELCHWTELPPGAQTATTGWRGGRRISGEVHDPNAWCLGDFCSHSGLFATAKGLARSLLNLQEQTKFLDQLSGALDNNSPGRRFVLGWDTPSIENSLAGEGRGPKTFGHLGFTGTSIWIDCDRKVGQILLTNGVRGREGGPGKLNEFRRQMGTLGWSL